MTIRKLTWQSGNGGTHFAISDGDIVAEVSFMSNRMAILGLQMDCTPPQNVDKFPWAQAEVLRFLNTNHGWAIWQ
jgi:hypothetical protein